MTGQSPRLHRRGLLGGAAVALAVVLVAAACDEDDDAAPEPDAVLGAGDTYEATIHRTEGGVPHIVADDEASLTFGQGWASAEDRSCDLADQVVKVKGERAATFGAGDDDEHLESDFAWRTIGIYDRATDDWEQAPDEIRELFTAFADGWNAHLAEVGVDGIAGWCRGEDWVAPVEALDVYAYARAIALQASSSAISDFLDAQPPDAGDDPDDGDGDANEALGAFDGTVAASNGWAIGADRSAEGGGMLLSNPHFPWEGELRFWEVHLTIPDELDIYGAQLSGLPGIGFGFTEEFAWTHTVSAGNRFTAYRLDLVPGDPTTYVYGDEERAMTSEEITVEVLADDGTTEEITRTVWSSHYGPVIDFPGFGWTEDATITFRDANIDNAAFPEQYLGMLEAGDLDEFIAVHEEITGVPLFNTIAVSADGRAWYADTSTTPNLSDEAIDAYEELVETDPIVATAADAGAVLLDGSDPLFEWVEVPGARDPGLVPFADMPAVERDDYVFNANDSFWVSHATELLEGDYSPLHGTQRTPVSPRTRENALVLEATAPDTPGDEVTFTLDELADAALANVGLTARELREDVVDRCTDADPVTLEPLVVDGEEVLAAEEVDVGDACEVLADWDGTYHLDSVGAVVWRELMHRFDADTLRDGEELWAEPFDPDDPIGTPSGLAPADGDDDPILEPLARAVQILEAADVDVDTPIGDVQFAIRGDAVIPLHGGDNRDGVTNIIGYGTSWSTLEPIPERGEQIVDDSQLATTDDRTGYLINNGTSFLLALAYGDDGPDARVFLTYSNTQDRDAPEFAEGTQRFSEGEWREVRFHLDDVADDPERTTVVVRG